MHIGSVSITHGAYLREVVAAAKVAGGGTGRVPVSTSSDTKVTISDAAASRFAAEQTSGTQQAGRAEAGQGAGYKLPDWWVRTEFPEDIMAEAKARLAERRLAQDREDGALPSGVHGLPMLPENQELLQQIRREMGQLKQDLSDPVKHRRFNELMNLTIPLMANGWAKPMTEDDLVREREISQAMALIQNRSAPPAGSGSQTPASSDHPGHSDVDPMAGWKRRWAQDGLTMPDITFKFDPKQSIWLDLAKEAGIEQEEFLEVARGFAQSLRGEALTQKVECFISDRYVALRAAQKA